MVLKTVLVWGNIPASTSYIFLCYTQAIASRTTLFETVRTTHSSLLCPQVLASTVILFKTMALSQKHICFLLQYYIRHHGPCPQLSTSDSSSSLTTQSTKYQRPISKTPSTSKSKTIYQTQPHIMIHHDICDFADYCTQAVYEYKCGHTTHNFESCHLYDQHKRCTKDKKTYTMGQKCTRCLNPPPPRKYVPRKYEY